MNLLGLVDIRFGFDWRFSWARDVNQRGEKWGRRLVKDGEVSGFLRVYSRLREKEKMEFFFQVYGCKRGEEQRWRKRNHLKKQNIYVSCHVFFDTSIPSPTPSLLSLCLFSFFGSLSRSLF